MMNNVIRCFLLIGIVSFSFLAKGQANYRKGYIITNSNDTIYGRINDRGDYDNTRACWFKEEKNSKVIKYAPADIKAYRMIDDKYYMSRQVDKKGTSVSTFVEVLIDGKVNLYYYLKGKKTKFYLEKENSEQLIGLTNEKLSEALRPLPEVPVSYSKDYYLTNKAYLDTLSSVFRDDPKIQKALYTIPYYRKSMMRITKKYIKDKCKGNDCLTYVKDISRNNPTFGVFTGVQLSEVSVFLDKGHKEMFTTNVFASYPVGAFINIALPVISDRLSVQLELINHRMHYSEANPTPSIKGMELNSNLLSIPLLLKYEIKREKLSPSLSVGTEPKFVRSIGLARELGDGAGWFGEMGLNYKIHNRLSIFANLRVESKQHLLELNSDNTLRYVNNNPENYKLVIGNMEARTDFAALYVGIRF